MHGIVFGFQFVHFCHGHKVFYLHFLVPGHWGGHSLVNFLSRK